MRKRKQKRVPKRVPKKQVTPQHHIEKDGEWVKLVGERTSGWAIEDGLRGIAVIDLDPKFLDAVHRAVTLAGLHMTIYTTRGSVSFAGEVKKNLLELFMRSYVRTAREVLAKEAGTLPPAYRVGSE